MVAMVERYERDLERITPPGGASDFVLIERPVFKEHVNRDGIEIDADALKKICRNCNDRIRETGDFSPLVIGHTDEDGENEPAVVGFVGPYRMGRLGKKKPVAAIYAKQWIRREHAEALKKYPRLSVEYWADKDDPTNGHFDPISLLGAETPELDLGIHYQRDKSGKSLMRYRRVMRYSAFPGGAPNTSLPGMVSGKAKKHEYGKEHGSMSPEELNQLIEAMQPIIKQMVDEAMNPMPLEGEPETVPPPIEESAPAEGMPPGGPPAPGMDTPPMDDDGGEMDMPPPGEPDGDESKATMYRRERDSYRDKYSREVAARRKAEEQLASLQAELGEHKAEKQRVERYSRLKDLQTQGFVIDPDEELADATDMSDSQFDKHLDRIQSKYQRAPVGVRIPTERPKQYTGHSTEEKRERYARVAREETEKLRANSGKGRNKIQYADVLANVIKNDGKYIPE